MITKSDEIIRKKLEVSVEFICRLYKLDLITNAYIVGSVAEGTARYDSDIDLNLVNPKVSRIFRLSPDIIDPIIQKIIGSINKIGGEFKNGYIIYDNEKFDIFVFEEFNPAMGIISIYKYDC